MAKVIISVACAISTSIIGRCSFAPLPGAFVSAYAVPLHIALTFLCCSFPLSFCVLSAPHSLYVAAVYTLSLVFIWLQVWDKDVLTEDDMIGRCCWMFTPKEVSAAMRHKN